MITSTDRPGRRTSASAEFKAFIAQQRAREQAAIAAVGDMSGGGILRHLGGARWVFILPDVAGQAWRIQRFDARGFSGHELHADADVCVRLSVGEGFTERDDGALDRMQGTPAFQRGNYAADLIRRINCREIDYAAADALLAAYDAEQAAAGRAA
jgi:hypothetical protein